MEENSFFKSRCHHHHRYSGGLAEYAWQTYQIALYIKNELIIQDCESGFLNEDSIAICAILHDLCNCSNMAYIRGHGRRSVKIGTVVKLNFILSHTDRYRILFNDMSFNITVFVIVRG